MDGGAEFVADPGGEEQPKGLLGRFEGRLLLRDPVVAIIERRFDIEPDPAHQRQDLGETIGENPGCVQSDFEPEILHRAHGTGKAGLRGWLTAAEYNPLQKIPAFREAGENHFPAPAAFLEWLEVGVVAVAAPPYASLAENHGREVSRIVHGGERDKASDLKFGRPLRRRIAGFGMWNR